MLFVTKQMKKKLCWINESLFVINNSEDAIIMLHSVCNAYDKSHERVCLTRVQSCLRYMYVYIKYDIYIKSCVPANVLHTLSWLINWLTHYPYSLKCCHT